MIVFALFRGGLVRFGTRFDDVIFPTIPLLKHVCVCVCDIILSTLPDESNIKKIEFIPLFNPP